MMEMEHDFAARRWFMRLEKNNDINPANGRGARARHLASRCPARAASRDCDANVAA